MAAALYYDIVSVFFVLAVMILVHEWGHFAAAKLFGVRVEVFSIGFGKRLAGFRRGDTDYRISLLPFGGYVKMSGENPLDQRTGTPEEFMSPSPVAACDHRAGRAIHEHRAGGRTADLRLHGALRAPDLSGPGRRGGLGSPPAAPPKRRESSRGDKIIQIGSTRNPDWEYVLSKIMISPLRPWS